MPLFPCLRAKAKNITVVIDPGHGGENLGGHTDEFIEQELTIEVAHYMKERLSSYEGVDVYLTHSDIGSKDISRSDRVKIAKEHNADLLVSLHFNMSENNNLFGTEAWTSAFGEYYSKGQEFATIWTNDMSEKLLLFNRGVKTRIGKSGEDYYGIIQSGKKNDIPTVIIEHCHLDEERDNFILKENDNPFELLGNIDADAVAKYFRLSSDTLNLDFSDYDRESFEALASRMDPDKSEPDYCEIEFIELSENGDSAKIRLKANDNDSYIQYYSYSLDGGMSYSKLYPFNEDINALNPSKDDSIDIDIALSEENESNLQFRVYNKYDLYTESNLLSLPKALKPVEEISKERQDYEEEIKELSYSYPQKNENDNSFERYIIYAFFAITIIFIMIIAVLWIDLSIKKRRHRK